MTEQIARLYSFAAILAVFFVTWATVAAHPWGASAPQDPRVAALAARELRVRSETAQVNRLVDRRWAVYRAALKQRNAANARIAAAGRQAAAQQTAVRPQATVSQPSNTPSAPVVSVPRVRVVMLPPLTVTKTS